jgi:hypothetical protein
MTPHVVYHAAAMGNWRHVVIEQFGELVRAGLTDVRISHVGIDRDWLMDEAARQGITATLFASDINTDHYETFAMFEIERLAKESDRPILYLHTKGVSDAGNHTKQLWRWLMNRHVVAKWRDNMPFLDNYDAVGVNFVWRDDGLSHFAGNFWLANADYIRTLPRFADFHNHHNRIRFTCEWWIGSVQQKKMKSLVVENENWGDVHGPHFERWATEISPPTITWVSAATRQYRSDLARLMASTAVMGPGHAFRLECLDDSFPVMRGNWRRPILKAAAATCQTTHLFWIDADCEFLADLQTPDLTGKPMTVVKHFGSNDVRTFMPQRLRDRITWKTKPGSWQGCLHGGTVAAMMAHLDRLQWMDAAGETYDEYGMVLDWSEHADDVLTLPCRYAAPSTFAPFPEYERTYNEWAGGAPLVRHHNRARNRG